MTRIQNTSQTNLNLHTFDICFFIKNPTSFYTYCRLKIWTLLLQVSKFKQVIAWRIESPCALAHRRLREEHQCTHTYLHLYFWSLPAMQIQTRSWRTKHSNWWGFHSTLLSVTRGFQEFNAAWQSIPHTGLSSFDSRKSNNFLLICL